MKKMLFKTSYGVPFEDIAQSSTVAADYLRIVGNSITNDFTVPTEAQFDEVWTYLSNRYFEYLCFMQNEENVINTTEFKKFIRKYISIFNLTKDRYITLLNIYSGNKAKLMDRVKSKTTSSGKHIFNDTPQTTNVSLDSSDYATNINYGEDTVESENDLNTVMSRIDEITSSYRNLMKEWTNEFAGLFIEPDNENSPEEVEEMLNY
jgi:hypothetical protein